MIQNEQILSAIEKHLVNAKTAKTNSEMREQLVAMKALCDVLLLYEVGKSSKNYAQHVQNVQHVQTIQPIQPIQSIQSIPSQPVSPTNKLQEDDGANGDSIFDF